MRHVRTYLAAEPNGLATSWDPPTNFAKLENSQNWLKNPHRLWLENKIRGAGTRLDNADPAKHGTVETFKLNISSGGTSWQLNKDESCSE